MTRRAFARTAGAAVLALGGVAVLISGQPADATSHARRADTGTKVIQQSRQEPTVVTRVHGLGRGCPDFVGRLIEHRHLVISGYQRATVAHASTLVNATVELVPTDSSAVSYSGGYRSLQIGVFSHGGYRTERSTTFTLGHLHGTDGSTFRTIEDDRIWRDKSGRTHHTDDFHCE